MLRSSFEMNVPAEIFLELDKNPSISAYAGAARKLKSVSGGSTPFRAAVLSNHTFDIGIPLTVECARRGLQLTLYSAGYDQYRQELLNSNGELARFQPDAILISLHLESTFPSLAPTTSAAARNLPSIQDWSAQFQSLITTYRQRSTTPIFIQTFVPPGIDMDGLLAGPGSVFSWVLELNATLRRMASELPSVFVVDAAKLAFGSNLGDWRDARLWLLAKVGINPKKFPLLGSHIARCFAALRRPAAKCLVMDLDNTVWGGILGEVGYERIHCADTGYPGNAYAEFQRALLGLRSRGIVLAVASKNDRAWVEEVFRKRTDMPLRPEHITEWEVHWDPKPTSLRRIAARLNIGLDALVFLDDNPTEIELIKMALPDVRAYQMPAKPEEFVDFLAKLEDFDQLHLSMEDTRRAELYELRTKQVQLAEAATDLESFYRSLKTVLTPEEANSGNLDRIVQLFHKTNQFNLTTRRHDKARLLERLAHGSEVWAFRARDVHGDHGIIAVTLLDFEAAVCKIDSFLMSCRVIGRTLETAILHFCEQRGLARGATKVTGEYLPTPKNGPCANFYGSHGFDRAGEQGTEWTKKLEVSPTSCPEWIDIEQQPEPICRKN